MLIHGHYYEPEFLAWKNMIARCTLPRFARWYSGVSICDRWLNSYEDFLADVGRRPTDKHTLDREENKGNYEPGNVRWVTRTIQSQNTRNHCTNKTGARGVSWSKSKGRFRAHISVKNKQVHLGYFESIEAAAAARVEAENAYWYSGDK